MSSRLFDCFVNLLIRHLLLPLLLAPALCLGMGVMGAVNSFPADTLVHVRPAGASGQEATQAKAVLKPIGELQPGDEVLALAEWKDKGSEAQADGRLSYERVTDVFTSQREQVLVHVRLDNGETITATEGHPFKTAEGWRDAVLLKRGGQLLLKGGAADGSERSASIEDVRIETKVVQVFNLEVANAHTFFVGRDGVVVHNAHGHHSDPKFLGGDPNQPLTNMPDADHRDLHRDMNDHLDGYSKNGRTMRPKRGNCGQKIRSTFTRNERLDALEDFYKGPGSKYSDAADDFFNQHPGRR